MSYPVQHIIFSLMVCSKTLTPNRSQRQSKTRKEVAGGHLNLHTVIPADTLLLVKNWSVSFRVLQHNQSLIALHLLTKSSTVKGSQMLHCLVIILSDLSSTKKKAANVEEIADEYFSDVFETSNSKLVNASKPCISNI